MKAFFFVVDEILANVVSAQALNITKLTGCDVHIFVERRDRYAAVLELSSVSSIKYHYDVLGEMLPPNLPGSKKWPAIVYLRVFAPFFLQNYDRVIYLDADVHCRHFDERIWSLELPSGLAAVHDLVVARSQPLGLTISRREWLDSIGVASDRYFNSGVLVIDVRKWCQENFAAKLTDYFENYGSKVFMYDQDFLNYMFQDKWVELSPQWNFQAALFHFGFEDFFNPILYHYSQDRKPWFKDNNFEENGYRIYKFLFEQANLDITSQHEDRRHPKPDFLTVIKWKVRQYLSRIGITSRKEKRLRKRWEIRRCEYEHFFRDSLSANCFSLDTRSEFQTVKPKLTFTGRKLLVEDSAISI
ncbi:glycosyl transferase family 8 [Loktanella sp. PT4BL]|jgi:lipopolysaccharide biosynthesis glycosyltransferase|uniref:glycosyltransferase family 8 protein n=1 Tax=Loktanella sp. PT4BL TaxID=2135611 RepID=UPI000D76E489|nr:glycosyltransferase [Loktanella sp. PT4BL]PXW69290.1 glycosyl transferase family 8 [Loktanella sp. PT4BL]